MEGVSQQPDCTSLRPLRQKQRMNLKKKSVYYLVSKNKYVEEEDEGEKEEAEEEFLPPGC